MGRKANHTSQRASAGDGKWCPAVNPAAKELLDHIAEELAKEYVRLMKEAASAESDPSSTEEE